MSELRLFRKNRPSKNILDLMFARPKPEEKCCPPKLQSGEGESTNNAIIYQLPEALSPGIPSEEQSPCQCPTNAKIVPELCKGKRANITHSKCLLQLNKRLSIYRLFGTSFIAEYSATRVKFSIIE